MIDGFSREAVEAWSKSHLCKTLIKLEAAIRPWIYRDQLCISGSAALWAYTLLTTGKEPKWKWGDIDIFLSSPRVDPAKITTAFLNMQAGHFRKMYDAPGKCNRRDCLMARPESRPGCLNARIAGVDVQIVLWTPAFGPNANSGTVVRAKTARFDINICEVYMCMNANDPVFFVAPDVADSIAKNEARVVDAAKIHHGDDPEPTHDCHPDCGWYAKHVDVYRKRGFTIIPCPKRTEIVEKDDFHACYADMP